MSGTSLRVLLLTCLLPAGVRCVKDAVFVYSSVGGEVVLPCGSPAQNQKQISCSSVSWTFYRGGQVSFIQEVSGGQVWAESDRSSRLSIRSDCSVMLQQLQREDAGSYMCLQNEQRISDVYLSLLSLSSTSTISELQPGGHLRLTCTLHTYYDAGSCKYSSTFSLRWTTEDGGDLQNQSNRYHLTQDSRCNITLLIHLQSEDNNRRFRCQLDLTGTSRAAFIDFTSTFLFKNPPETQNQNHSVAEVCPVQLPISRIVVCLVLPVLVVSVGLFTWKLDHKRVQKSAAAIELQDLS